MRMPRTLALVAWIVAGWLPAQDFTSRLEIAQECIAAKEWKEAFEILSGLTEKAPTDDERARLAKELLGLGETLYGEGVFAEALHVCELALAQSRILHGDRDHPAVARGLHDVAACLQSLGRASEALLQNEAALAMRQRLYADRDHPAVATSLNNVASCLQDAGRASDALPLHEAALAMWQRLRGDRDHPDVADGLNRVARCLKELGRMSEALRQFEAALVMRRRLNGDRDHPDVAMSLNNVAACLEALGRASEALPQFEAALAMARRLFGERDHWAVAHALNNVAFCLESLGRGSEALPKCEAALAMRLRLYGDRDHPEVATSLSNVAACLESLGRASEALPKCEAALAIRQRLYGDRDHPDVATSLNNLAAYFRSLGRASEALPQFEAALAMRKRLYGGRDHPDVASSLRNVASCLQALGRASEALLQNEAALAMWIRLYGDRDHPDVATGLTNVAACLESLGRASEALPQFEAALAMRQRLYGDRDHPEVARSLNNVAFCLESLGRVSEALPQLEAALAMWIRLYGDRDHPDVATGLNNVAFCRESLGRVQEALASAQEATSMIERLRDDAQMSPELRQSFFEELKRGGAFERSQVLASRLGRPSDALHAAERGRGRDLLDHLAQFGDPETEAERRARARGDEASASRLATLRTDLAVARTESDRLLHELTRLDDLADDAERTKRRVELVARSNAVSKRLRQLLDERARLLGDVLPVGRVRDAAEIQGALRQDELLLEFTLTRDVAMLYVIAKEGDVQVVELPAAFATVQRILPRLLQRNSHAQLRGREPGEGGAPAADASDAESRELFASLIPAPVWERVRTQQRVFIAAHRELHRVPFELLVTDTRDGKPVPWLDAGPPVSYVSSGTMLHWLRHRAEAAANDSTSLDLLAVGDPRRLEAEPEVPEQGVFVVAVKDGGEGARLGLQPGDVLTSYDGAALADDKALRDVRMATERAIEDGQREKKPIPIAVWRRGATLTVDANAGPLGIEVGAGRARAVFEASLGSEAQMQRITRSGDLERLGRLPLLRGARDEAEAIHAVFGKREAKSRLLLGADATEPSVFDLAGKAKYLHFAGHGIAEEYAGQSLSMLVLSQPQRVLPGDDGLLKLGDLFSAWRGRLASCRLVVLSACRTNVGPTLRDESPQALPIGFLFAGAPAVISTLWAVDDASTKELMTDVYGRLLAGETDKLAAFTAAKKALRQKYPDPFHWAPFLYMGAPD